MEASRENEGTSAETKLVTSYLRYIGRRYETPTADMMEIGSYWLAINSQAMRAPARIQDSTPTYLPTYLPFYLPWTRGIFGCLQPFRTGKETYYDVSDEWLTLSNTRIWNCSRKMNSFRKWLNKPKRDDPSAFARFYFADEELTLVAYELDSFDGRRDPERCSTLVTQLRSCQDKLLRVLQVCCRHST